MSGVNKAILLGNLGADPEVRTLENGVKVANFRIATSESYKDRNTGERITRTEWHNIVLWRGLAEVAERFLHKGDQIFVEGKLQTRTYQDKDGQNRYVTEVVANEMTMLGKRDSGDQSQSQNRPEPKQSAGSMQSSGNNQPENDHNAAEEDDDDLPF